MSKEKESTKKQPKQRPPIVVVVGHIDHGKTTLLDTIRKTKVAEKESGGITQHIGAYEIEHSGKKITFIDTPGHEAFSKMRSRGTAAADIGILVVAADEGVKPQTKEAIKILQDAGIPFLVAMNKIDKPGAQPERVKQELAEQQVLVESWGGKIPSIEISAKQAKNLNDLLELILLIAEVENFEAHDGPAEGIVIESHRDPGRGNTATLLLLDGHLKKGNVIAVGGVVENVKILENFLGRPIKEATYSMPVLISSLSAVPEVGQTFRSFEKRKDAEAYIADHTEEKSRSGAGIAVSEAEKPTLFVILKTDVSGSKEAIEGMIQTLQYPEIEAKILKSEVGDVNEADMKTASIAPHTVIAAFKVKVPRTMKDSAERTGVKIIESDIIYHLFEEMKTELAHLMPPHIERTDIGRAKILALFKKTDNRQIIGGRVTVGKISKGALCEVQRGSEVVAKGKVRELQHLKQNADEVREGLEFGAMLELSGDMDMKEGDAVVLYQEEKIYKKL